MLQKPATTAFRDVAQGEEDGNSPALQALAPSRLLHLLVACHSDMAVAGFRNIEEDVVEALSIRRY
jgi:hypothetical protein